jgi:hypothetical protein
MIKQEYGFAYIRFLLKYPEEFWQYYEKEARENGRG